MSRTLRVLAQDALTKSVVRDVAVAMVNEGLRYVDLTVGAPDGTSISIRIFLTKATVQTEGGAATTIKIGGRRT